MPDVITFREAHALDRIIAGKTPAEAFRLAGFGRFICEHPTAFIDANPGLKAELDKARSEAIYKLGVNAEHVLDELIRQLARLTQQAQRLHGMLGHDIMDLYHMSGEMMRIEMWPEVWRKQLITEIETVEQTMRSHDGETGEKRGGWDVVGKVRKIKRESTLAIEKQLTTVEKEIRECLGEIGRHVDVKAFPAPSQDTNINITITAQQQRLDRAKLRMQRVIEAKPENA